MRGALESRNVIRQIELPPEPFKIPPVDRPTPPPVVSIPVSVEPQTIAPIRQSFLDMEADDRPSMMPILNDSTDVASPKVEVVTIEDLPAYTPPTAPTVEEVIPQPIVSPPIEELQQTVMEQAPDILVLGELFRTYILAQMGESLFIIDKHAAHERILYNQLKAESRVDEQMLLTPVAVTVSRDEHTALLESVDELKQAGITVEDFGGQCVLVRTFPMILAGADIDAAIREIAAGFVGGNREVQSSKLDWIYHSSACRAAIKAGDTSRPAEWLDLAKKVLLDESIRYCPHGRPVCVEMTRKELEKQFGRIV